MRDVICDIAIGIIIDLSLYIGDICIMFKKYRT